MTLELEKATPVPLRTLGLDEKWLQDRISSDPTILGLGDNLEIAGREHHQPIGGRIDHAERGPQLPRRRRKSATVADLAGRNL